VRKTWIEYAKKADFDSWSKALQITPLTARILRNRDILTLEEARKYLYGTLVDLENLSDIQDMEKAIGILKELIHQKAKVCIASDYDVDGVFSSQILKEAFEYVGLTTLVLSPNRFEEGYGINRRMIEQAKNCGCTAIVTCDNGIAAKEELQFAKDLGFTLIVTDHHEPQFDVLPADAVVDLKVSGNSYSFKELCGAGIAFRLVQGLYRALQIPQEKENELLEYVAIATVSDVVPLLDENRILVKAGLEALRHTRNHGLRALMDVQMLSPEKISAFSIGFVIGPCFNAVSRLTGEADLSRDLLNAASYQEAFALAEKMTEMNQLRKDMTEEGYQEAVELVENSSWKEDPILVVPLTNSHESIVGIVAGRLKEKYARPVIVLTPGKGETDADGNPIAIMKGSGRSIEAYHMMEGLMEVKDLLFRFGGHKMACGLSIVAENVDIFRRTLIQNCRLTEKDLTPVLHIDARIPFSYITKNLVRELAILEPFGTANEKPVFARPHLKLKGFKVMGKNQNVLRLTLVDEGTRLDGIKFGDVPEFVQFLVEHIGQEATERLQNSAQGDVDIAMTFYPDINEYQGMETVQVRVEDYCIIE